MVGQIFRITIFKTKRSNGVTIGDIFSKIETAKKQAEDLADDNYKVVVFSYYELCGKFVADKNCYIICEDEITFDITSLYNLK